MILENDVIKYNQVPDFIKSTEVSRKLDMKLKKGRASYHKSSLDENMIIDKLVLSPIIVRAKLLKIIKSVQTNPNYVVGDKTTLADFVILRIFVMLEDKYYGPAYSFLRDEAPELASISDHHLKNQKIKEFFDEIREKKIQVTSKASIETLLCSNLQS